MQVLAALQTIIVDSDFFFAFEVIIIGRKRSKPLFKFHESCIYARPNTKTELDVNDVEVILYIHEKKRCGIFRRKSS